MSGSSFPLTRSGQVTVSEHWLLFSCFAYIWVMSKFFRPSAKHLLHHLLGQVGCSPTLGLHGAGASHGAHGPLMSFDFNQTFGLQKPCKNDGYKRFPIPFVCSFMGRSVVLCDDFCSSGLVQEPFARWCHSHLPSVGSLAFLVSLLPALWQTAAREREREREISVPRGLSSFVGWPSNDIYNMGVHWLTQMGPPVQWITFSQVIGHAQHTGIAQKDAGPSLCTFSYYGG